MGWPEKLLLGVCAAGIAALVTVFVIDAVDGGIADPGEQRCVNGWTQLVYTGRGVVIPIYHCTEYETVGEVAP